MAATLINQTDFNGGEYACAITANNTAQFTQLMADVEAQWMAKLLGTTLSAAFIANAALNSGIPTGAAYLKIYNALLLEDAWCGDENYSTGIKNYLKALVWFNWNTTVKYTATQVGQRMQETTNSVPVNDFSYVVKYNQAIANMRVIQYYIRQNLADYPDYAGTFEKYNTPL